ncbi:MAG: enoyl-CoA hydratase-related protein [Pseudomonadota bacterium]|nr:enoyl-CoA hydratase-related protein [Pseudomonadota bacterium]
MMEYEQILFDIEDGILTLTLNRPERMNAFTYRMRDELLDALERADADDTVRAVIMTGSGRAFCAGADLSGGEASFEGEDRNAPWRDGGGMVTLRMFRLNKPIVAAYNGAAAGIGATLCLPADIRIASTRAKFGFVFTRRGVVLESCASWFLPRVVGLQQALRWCIAGSVFGAEEALKGGLVSELCEPEDLLDRAGQVCRELTDETSAVSVALVRQMLWRMTGAHHPMTAHRMESGLFGELGTAPDAIEGVASFLEKRPARFTMRPSADLPDTGRWWDDPGFDTGV